MGESEDYRIHQARKDHSRIVFPPLPRILYNDTLFHLGRSSLRLPLGCTRVSGLETPGDGAARLIAPRLNLCKSANVVDIQRGRGGIVRGSLIRIERN